MTHPVRAWSGPMRLVSKRILFSLAGRHELHLEGGHVIWRAASRPVPAKAHCTACKDKLVADALISP